MSAVHLSTNYPLGVLNNDFTARLRHRNHRRNHDKQQRNHQTALQPTQPHAFFHAQRCCEHFTEQHHALRQPRQNTDRNQQRNTVSDAVLRNLFAQPCQNHGTRGQKKRTDQQKPKTVVKRNRPVRRRIKPGKQFVGIIGQRHHQQPSLNEANQQRQITRVLHQTLATEFPFLLHLCQRRHHHTQQLENNGGTDVRHNAQPENRPFQKRSAREQIVKTDQLTAARDLLRFEKSF